MAGIAAVGRALLGNMKSCMYLKCGSLAWVALLLGVAIMYCIAHRVAMAQTIEALR